jgi:TolB protein
VDIHGPGQAKMNLVLSQPFAGSGQDSPARKLQDLINKNLTFLPFLQVVPQSQILGQINGPQADQIDFKPFGMARIDVLVTSNWTPGGNLGNVELRAFEVYSQKVLVGKGFDAVTDAQLRTSPTGSAWNSCSAQGQGGFSIPSWPSPAHRPKNSEMGGAAHGPGLTKITATATWAWP